MGKKNIVELAMRKHRMVFFFIMVTIIFGIIALPKLNKNEFPEVTIRTGVVAVIYPGATSNEIEERVAGKVEQYLFTFTDVMKSRTYSYSRDGVLYVFTELVPTVKDAPVTWARIREGLQLFRLTDLPQGVMATAVIDDFGAASSILLAIESPDRSSRELREYADQLSVYLREIPEMGNIKIVGEQKEEIAVHIDPVKMSQYAISPSVVSAELAAHGFRTISGQVDNEESRALVHVSIPYDDVYDLQEMVVFSDPITGQSFRLGDVATLERRYEPNKKYVTYSDKDTILTTNNVHCLVLSMEMRPGNNIVNFGSEVSKKIETFSASVPKDVRIHRITDQPKNVDRSVLSFLKDLMEAVLVVILVMLMLFPLRTALVSSLSVPVCIAASFAVMYLAGIELNTVTLAALIVVLGMIVDDSVVVIDGYTSLMQKGHSRWYSAAVSTKSLMGSMFISTCSISGMFFPMLATMKSSMLGDFIRMFPWAIFIALTCSFLFAVWVIPFLATQMIRVTASSKMSPLEKAQSRFFGWLQNGYKRLLDLCFRHKIATVVVASVLTALGGFLVTRINVQLLPKAERDSFAVEIHMEASSDIRETAAVADSLVQMLLADKRVVSVTSFMGQSSPRFHMTYAPQMADDAYAQFIVNTKSEKATKSIFKDYPQKYENRFADAQIRFKQMDYQAIASPVEIFLKGDDYEKMEPIKDSIVRVMKQNPNLFFVHSDFDETTEIVEIQLDTEEANRLGISQSMLSIYLSGSLSGSRLSSTWEGDYDVPISVYTEGVENLSIEAIGDLLIPCAQPGMWVPLRQIASITPSFHHNSLTHRNGVRSITIAADVVPNASQMKEALKVGEYLDKIELPQGVSWQYGGAVDLTRRNMGPALLSVLVAILVMFLVLVIHYGEIGISVLTITQSLICLFGSALGLWFFGLELSITALLGLISLIGIVVRNGIIMYDYAGELRKEKHLSAHDAIYEAGLRRMRPIFLTSATTALGVVPMILAKTQMWEPMGVVICIGTLVTLPLVITLLPVTYSLVFSRDERRKQRMNKMSKNFEKQLQAREKRIEEFNLRNQNSQPNPLKMVLPFILLLGAAAQAFASQPITLDSCIARAKATNCTIRTAQMDIQKAKAVKHQMFTKFFPQATVNTLTYSSSHHLIGVNYYQTDDWGKEYLDQILRDETGELIADEVGLMKSGVSIGATIMQPIYAGGRIRAANRLANVGIEASELKASMTERDVIEEIVDSYLLVLGLQEKVATVNAALALLDSLDRVVKAGEKAGVLEPTDALRLELKKNEIRAKQLQLKNGIELASRLLCLQAGLDYPAEGLTLAPVDDVLPTNAVGPRPELRLLQLNIDAQRLRRRLTIGETLPTIGMGWILNYGNLFKNGTAYQMLSGKVSEFNANAIFLTRISIPITDWWETGHKIREHNIAIQQAEISKDDLLQKMQLQEDKARADMMEAQALMESDAAALRMAQEVYRLAELNYHSGMETMTNVLEANTLMLQAQNALTDRRISYLSSRLRYHDLAGE